MINKRSLDGHMLSIVHLSAVGKKPDRTDNEEEDEKFREHKKSSKVYKDERCIYK